MDEGFRPKAHKSVLLFRRIAIKSQKLPIILVVFVVFAMACVCTGTSKLVSPTATPPPPANTEDQSSQANPSGFVSQVVLAKDAQGDTKDPVNPTRVFTSKDTIHAVVIIENAPDNTIFKAIWYIVDVGNANQPNSVIDSNELVSGGTRNLDFSLPPDDQWPAGSYKVEIYVNEILDQVVNFKVQY
jgi:hypothetical protein